MSTRRAKNSEHEQRRLQTERLLQDAARELNWPVWQRFSVFFGQTHYTVQRGRSYKKGYRLYLTVPHFWLETVHQPGLLLLDNRLVLEATRAPEQPPAEAVWRVKTLSADMWRNFRLSDETLIRYGGCLWASTSLSLGLQRAISTFHAALTGEYEPPF